MQAVPRKPAEVSPPRMGALAKLPVFLDLAGKRVVVAGGTAAAAWKAELAAAAGADVLVYAVEPGAEMRDLLARGSPAGRISHVPRAWHPACLAGAAVAFADAADEDEARDFLSAARNAGALANVVDRPAYCQFQLGAIVNRSPVVVAVSTDGGAPILGQAIRRRLETLLPPSLAAWGDLAKRVRAVVNARLATAAERRSFWQRLSERAMTEPAPDAVDVERVVASLASSQPAVDVGRVTLVGAGPGDAELLTLKAVRAMQSADVILFDDLVSDEVLELARREAKRMAVGKRGRRESCNQSDINALMVKLARQGRSVVRLKSGDPMIFGRAGEEIAALERHGIPVEVVPGVTSALAAAASLGVSLTHRDCARSVRFVTGHDRDGRLPADLDWRGLADPATTLVFYMAARTAPLIAENLLGAGMPPDTPVAVVANATHRDERRWCGALHALAAGTAGLGTAGPTLIGIGRAFAAADRSSAWHLDDVRRTSASAIR